MSNQINQNNQPMNAFEDCVKQDMIFEEEVRGVQKVVPDNTVAPHLIKGTQSILDEDDDSYLAVVESDFICIKGSKRANSALLLNSLITSVAAAGAKGTKHVFVSNRPEDEKVKVLLGAGRNEAATISFEAHTTLKTLELLEAVIDDQAELAGDDAQLHELPMVHFYLDNPLADLSEVEQLERLVPAIRKALELNISVAISDADIEDNLFDKYVISACTALLVQKCYGKGYSLYSRTDTSSAFDVTKAVHFDEPAEYSSDQVCKIFAEYVKPAQA